MSGGVSRVLTTEAKQLGGGKGLVQQEELLRRPSIPTLSLPSQDPCFSWSCP